jgi:hypothetical protein
VPDPFVRQLIVQSSAAKGVNRRPLTPDEIQRRALLAMVNEAALLLAEGVTSRAMDVDVAMVQRVRFSTRSRRSRLLGKGARRAGA